MQRVRRVGSTALAFLLALGWSGLPVVGGPWSAARADAASVPWPTSSLVVSEVQTGGASASDEFVEIANQGSDPVDLVGLEIVYATSSGSTVTRKATWTDSFVLTSGQRVLVVNGAGALAGIGDLVYTGGFAATGGALALRIVGGSVIDAIGWGDASNPFVEGVAAPAPPAGSSLERRPGGAAGNGVDTNDNATDWLIAPTPSPQPSTAPPVPGPGPTPTPIPTPAATPTPVSTATPTPVPTPEPTPDPTATPSPTPTPAPTPEPTPTTTPTPAPTPISIAAARAMTLGAEATVSGVLTTDLGALETGRTAFIEDETAGIAVYLDATVASVLPAGTAVVVAGTVDRRYEQVTLRVAEPDIVVIGQPGVPSATNLVTGDAGEAFEGRRIAIAGAVVGPADALADGTAVSVDDGSGPVRIVVTPAAMDGRTLSVGSLVTASGPLGQRDSSGTGTSGYRLYVTFVGELTVEPPPTPTPTPAPTPEPTPSPTPSPSATPSPSGTPSPTPTPDGSPSPSGGPNVVAIATARSQAIGTIVTVRGMVTAEAGRLGSPPLLAIADASGGIVVRLPGDVPPPARGHVLVVRGPLADPYGQLEIRPTSAMDVTLDGSAPLPDPIDLDAASPDETTEGRLVRSAGLVVVRPTKATSGDITVTIETSGGTQVRIMADASSTIRTDAFGLGGRYRLTGVAGQRASKKGMPDGYRIWLRDPSDIALLSAPPSPTPSPSPKPKPTPKPSVTSGGAVAGSVVSIATAIRTTTKDVSIDAVVTAPATLLDSTGRRIVVQDGTGAIEVLLSKDVRVPGVGTRITASGRVGSAYGAPRLRATGLTARGSGTIPAPLRVAGPFTAAHTWRLVSITGRIDDLKKLGDRWRAEVIVGAQRLVVVGQPGARIPITSLTEGRSIDVVGIVRPAYPTASDKRPSLLPRSSADVHPGSAVATAGGAATTGDGTTSSGNAASGGDAAATTPPAPTAPDVDLDALEAAIGMTVRVGGLVVELRASGFTLDDGTAVGLVILAGAAADWVDLIEPGDAINVVGRVARVDGTVAVVVEDPAAIVLGSDVGGAAGAAASSTPPGSPGVTAADEVSEAAALGDTLGGFPGTGVSIAGLIGISLASVLVTTLRRRHGRRLLAVRVAARLAAIGRSAGADSGSTGPAAGA